MKVSLTTLILALVASALYADPLTRNLTGYSEPSIQMTSSGPASCAISRTHA